MSSFMAALSNAKGAIAAVAVIGGGALTFDALKVDQSEYDEYVASNRVSTILDLANQARDEGSPDYLCDAIEEEFAALCTEAPSHYWCRDDDAKEKVKTKAGCE